jgi:hypothetical protein
VPKESERRRGERRPAYLPAEILVDRNTTRSAITKNISDHGLLLLTRARLRQNQAVLLRVHLFLPRECTVLVQGQVVRREALSDEEQGTWREKVAVRFDQVQPELAQESALFTAENAAAKLYDCD